MRRRAEPRSFTLLEAVLATVILSSVVVVCLELRAQTVRHATRIDARQQVMRETDSLLTMATGGFLGEPQVDAESRTLTWTGSHLGSPYEVVASPVEMDNPAAHVTDLALSPKITLWRFAIEYRGERTEVLWR